MEEGVNAMLKKTSLLILPFLSLSLVFYLSLALSAKVAAPKEAAPRVENATVPRGEAECYTCHENVGLCPRFEEKGHRGPD